MSVSKELSVQKLVGNKEFNEWEEKIKFVEVGNRECFENFEHKGLTYNAFSVDESDTPKKIEALRDQVSMLQKQNEELRKEKLEHKPMRFKECAMLERNKTLQDRLKEVSKKYLDFFEVVEVERYNYTSLCVKEREMSLIIKTLRDEVSAHEKEKKELSNILKCMSKKDEEHSEDASKEYLELQRKVRALEKSKRAYKKTINALGKANEAMPALNKTIVQLLKDTDCIPALNEKVAFLEEQNRRIPLLDEKILLLQRENEAIPPLNEKITTLEQENYMFVPEIERENECILAMAGNKKRENDLPNERVCSLEKKLGENEKEYVTSLRDLAELCEECVEGDNTNCTANVSADEVQRYVFILHNKINSMRRHTNEMSNKLASSDRKSDQQETDLLKIEGYLSKIEEHDKRTSVLEFEKLCLEKEASDLSKELVSAEEKVQNYELNFLDSPEKEKFMTTIDELMDKIDALEDVVVVLEDDNKSSIKQTQILSERLSSKEEVLVATKSSLTTALAQYEELFQKTKFLEDKECKVLSGKQWKSVQDGLSGLKDKYHDLFVKVRMLESVISELETKNQTLSELMKVEGNKFRKLIAEKEEQNRQSNTLNTKLMDESNARKEQHEMALKAIHSLVEERKIIPVLKENIKSLEERVKTTSMDNNVEELLNVMSEIKGNYIVNVDGNESPLTLFPDVSPVESECNDNSIEESRNVSEDDREEEESEFCTDNIFQNSFATTQPPDDCDLEREIKSLVLELKPTKISREDFNFDLNFDLCSDLLQSKEEEMHTGDITNSSVILEPLDVTEIARLELDSMCEMAHEDDDSILDFDAYFELMKNKTEIEIESIGQKALEKMDCFGEPTYFEDLDIMFDATAE